MIYERPAWVTLIGSITLIFAVPITTALAAFVYQYYTSD